ncbi:MAG: hypothetical protein Q9199_005362 [Rusavskia elegans]
MPELQSFCDELLLMIIRATTKRGQKALRLASRHFNGLIIPLLMMRITTQTDQVSPRRWSALYSIGHLVTTLTLQAVDYENFDDRDWPDELDWRWNGYDLNDNLLYHDPHHRNQALGVYHRCRQKMQTDTLTCMTLLGDFLRHLPNLQHVCITDAAYKVRKKPYANKRCSIPNCRFPGQDHTVLALPPTSGLQALGFTILSGLVLGLSRTETRLPNLTIKSPQGWKDTGLHYGTLISHPAPVITQLPYFVNVISNLTELTLWLRYDEGLERSYFAGQQVFNVSRILSNATNLVQLDLSAEPGYGDNDGSLADFRAVFYNCVFHRLRSLTMYGFESSKAELLEFTDGCPNLVKLDIDSHELILGTWAAILEHWKTHLLSLSFVELNDLFQEPGGVRPSTVKSICSMGHSDDEPSTNGERAYLDLRGRVQAFFSQGAINPFSS